uniref:Uncharacterized protein n=1 Tax=Romanomermis culicivorax TaxID=13658 RepID=A0A915HV65_ROMCU
MGHPLESFLLGPNEHNGSIVGKTSFGHSRINSSRYFLHAFVWNFPDKPILRKEARDTDNSHPNDKGNGRTIISQNADQYDSRERVSQTEKFAKPNRKQF